MAGIIDKDTLLDLTVNVIPLGILLVFVTAFVIVDPFGGLNTYGRVLQFGLIAFPFVALAILTYVSGKAIAGDEQRSSVFFQGQATMEDAQTRHEAEEEIAAEIENDGDADAAEDAAEADD